MSDENENHLASKGASRELSPTQEGISSQPQDKIDSSRSAGNKAATKRNRSRPTAKQRHLIELFANPADTRDEKDKAAEVGVSRVTAWRWQQESWWAPELFRRQMIYIRALGSKAIRIAGLLLEHGEEESKRMMVNSIFKAIGAFPKDAGDITQVTNVTNTNMPFAEFVNKLRQARGLAPIQID